MHVVRTERLSIIPKHPIRHFPFNTFHLSLHPLFQIILAIYINSTIQCGKKFNQFCPAKRPLPFLLYKYFFYAVQKHCSASVSRLLVRANPPSYCIVTLLENFFVFWKNQRMIHCRHTVDENQIFVYNLGQLIKYFDKFMKSPVQSTFKKCSKVLCIRY